jgi:hypothetical protein
MLSSIHAICFPSIGVVVRQIKSLKNIDISVGKFSSCRPFDSRRVLAICVWQMKPPYLLKALIKLWMLELIMGWNGILCKGNELPAGSSLLRLHKSAALKYRTTRITSWACWSTWRNVEPGHAPTSKECIVCVPTQASISEFGLLVRTLLPRAY